MFYVLVCVTLCPFYQSVNAIISMDKIELVALLCLSSWCLVTVMWLFVTMPRVCLQFIIVVFPNDAHYFCCHLLGKS